MHIPEDLRRRVIARAGERCEYCGLAQVGQEATFHIDHIHPSSLGGSTELGNLALACVTCSLRKGAKTSAIDHPSGEIVPLFHPGRDLWNLHFRGSGPQIAGLSATGRATVDALVMNRPITLGIRREEALR
jgi:hypothetical protein